ncbi:hypothetical protein CASFOL_037506 [Castilleja foliolosa]|uniref:Uncharacterized protein n=1 Tax=Castilleja foliolosa TaxID=1961234 RepID=A0ABD3BN37_9LAMI
MDPKQTTFKVLMFPCLAHGHIFPFLELVKKLSTTKTFHIYFLSTSINLNSVRKSINDDNTISIEVVELQLPSPLMPTLMQAFQMSIPNFSQIIADLKPNLLIYDGFQPWSAKIASSLNIPSVLSATSASASLSFFHHQYTHKSFDTYPYPQIFLKEYELRNLASQGGSIEVNDNDEGFVFGIFKLSNDIVLIKSCRGIEGKYMDYLSKLCNRKIVPTGPLIPKNDADESQESAEIMDWSSKKSPFSTLYISFGSEITLDEILPREFVDGVKRTDRGVILKEWAPQAATLAHPSVGGFMSHCGWSYFSNKSIIWIFNFR